MSTGALARPTIRVLAWQRLVDYIELTKPRIALMALVTVAVGSVVGSVVSIDVALLAHTLMGTGLVAAGASVLNQVFERDTDALMLRTRHRPIPAGRVTVREAIVFGFGVSVVGLNYLCLIVNPLTGLLGAVTLVLYVFVYTPMKRWTALNTVVGAVPGALPPVMGWAAVRGCLDVEAWNLFLILFLWQFPHFLAIAWIYRQDYARAGLKMLPVLDRPGILTRILVVAYSVALLLATLVPTRLELAGWAYFYGALWLGLAFLWCSLVFAFFASLSSARNLMRASLIYLPILFVLMLLDLV